MPDQEFERGILFMPGGDPRFVGGFVQLPSAILRSKKLQPGEKTLYALLLDYAWGRGEAFPSQSTLAEDIGRGERHIREWLHHLDNLDLIRIQRRGLNMPNIYWITNPAPAWLEEEFRMYLASKAALGADRNQASGQERPPIPERQPTSSPPGWSGTLVPVPERKQSADEVDTADKVLLFPEELNPPVSASGKSEESSKINTARAPAREQEINTARVRPMPRAPEKNPDVLPLLSRHAEAYRNKVGASFPVAWAKDGAIIKRLLKTYSRAETETLQDAFFAQKLDSEAARRGYTVSQFAYEAPALMTAIKLREGLTDEQKDLAQALRDEGVTQDTALSLVHEHDSAMIRAQLAAHIGRRDRFANPAAALVKAIREGWAVPSMEEEPDYFKPIELAARRTDVVPPPPDVKALIDDALEHLTGKRAAT